MEELKTFTEFVYGEQRGFVYAPIKTDTAWVQKFFAWPLQRSQLHEWIESNSMDESVQAVYLSPVVYKEKRATKDAVKSSQVAWVEFDGQEQIDFTKLGVKPDAIVQTSSSTHLHCYWKVPGQPLETIEDINARLTYMLGADHSGIDIIQLLRPPGSYNKKPEYPQTYPVKLAFFQPGTHEPKAFDKAPAIEHRSPTVELTKLLNPKELLRRKQLPLALLRRVTTEVVKEPSRSSFLSKVAFDLAEEGLSHVEIVTLLYVVDERIGKFKDRTDRMLRLTQLADLALHRIEAEASVVLYSLRDVLTHTDELDWILPGWLHDTGYMILTSAPGVGKTQMILQLGTCLVQNRLFLNKTPLRKKEHKILFWSLEMDVRSLKYIVSHQSNEWGENDPPRFLIVDEEMPLSKMENIIESEAPTLLFLDSLSEILGDSKDANAEAKNAMRWIKKIRRRHRLAVVAIHHNRKASEGNKKPNKLDDLFGSFYFAKDVDTVINLWDTGSGIEVDGLKVRFGQKGAYGKILRNDNLWFDLEKKEDDTSNKPGTAPQLKAPGFPF